MVETAIRLGPFLDVSTTPSQDVKLPQIKCQEKTVELHKDGKISISHKNSVLWMHRKTTLNKFLEKNFTHIEKIEILKKIFHGLHTEERPHSIRYLNLLKKK